jgi:type IV pilus assembly protein PilF
MLKFRKSLAECLLRGLLLVAASVVVGCASNPNASTPLGGDLVTESDATDAQKLARIRLELASGYFEAGQTTDALDSVKQSLQFDPSNADAFNLRGLIYMKLNEHRLAEDSFKRAISLTQRNGDALHNYGWHLCNQLRYKEADGLFAQALRANGYTAHAKTHLAAGMCQQRSGMNAEAVNSYLRAYEIDPGNPFVGYNLSLLLYQRHDYARAEFYINRLNRSASANAQTYWLGIKVERKLGNNTEMRQLGARLQNRFPASDEARLYERGQFED